MKGEGTNTIIRNERYIDLFCDFCHGVLMVTLQILEIDETLI